MKIPLFGIAKQYKHLHTEINRALIRVASSGSYILGSEVESFEYDFAKYCGAKYCTGVASGHDAILLTLDALGIQPGDEVIVPAFTFISTVLPLLRLGIKPVLVDVKFSNATIDPNLIEKNISNKTKAILPVHLYGFPADMDTINGIAEKHNLLVIEDAAQSHGSIYKNKKAGTLSSAGCFSFYPTKNLGALGDGGAVVTDNKIIDTKLKILRNVGQAKKNIHIFKGYNSRLDEIQAAVLKVKLKHLDQWNNKRRAIASYYHHNLINKSIELLYDDTDSFSNYTLFTIYLKQRSKLYKYLDSHGVGSGIYYPTPIHLQPCLKQLGYKLGDFPQSEKLAKGALSIPVHQNLTDAEKRYVLDLLNKFK